LISQVINLSNKNTFNIYKEKYQFSIDKNQGMYGIELRNIPIDLFGSKLNSVIDNMYFSTNSLVIIGSFKEIIENVSHSNLSNELKLEFKNAIDKFEKSSLKSYKFGSRIFNFENVYIMGILNVTPDSFSDGGKYIDRITAVNYGLEMIEDGVDIIDIGGESTRPGSDPVSESEELNRVIPVISEIIKQKSDVVISIDTTKSVVAEEALKSGASIVNDISGGRFDKDIFNVVSEFDAGIIIMHIKDKPKTMQISPEYSDVVLEIYNYLVNQVEAAVKIGIGKIIIDPGIGFGKRNEDNLELINRLEDFKSLGFPILMGLSRKSFIGNILNLPVEDRDNVTNALNALCLNNGARIIRTHNVKQAVQTCKIYNRLISY
jgi:dihydropteroate synthase